MIYGSHRSVANKEAGLSWLSPEDSEQREQRKMPAPSLFLKEVCLHTLKAAKGSAFCQPISRC